MCLTRKPWLLVTEYMKYKDLGSVLPKLKKKNVPLRIHEMLYLPMQLADALVFLEEVCSYCQFMIRQWSFFAMIAY